MLDLLGSGYVVDCCIAAINSRRERDNWQTFMADVGTIVVRMLGGKEMPRFADCIKQPDKDEKSGADIAMDVIKRHGLKAVE